MAFFKEKPCAHCGKKTNMLTRVKLNNDQYICGKCLDKFPTEISQELTGHSYEEFLNIYNYINKVNPTLKKQFRETHKFHGIHIDTTHELFYLDFVSPTTYLQFKDLSDCNLEFSADEVKDGFLGAKVTGKIYLKLRMDNMLLYVDKVIATDIKASAKVSGVMNKKVTYENPKGMDEFIRHFGLAWNRAITQNIDMLLSQSDYLEDDE